MAALSSGRNTQSKGPVVLRSYPVEAATTIYVGGLVAVDDNGYVGPASAKTGTTPFVNMPKVVGVMNNVVSGDIGANAQNLSSLAGLVIPNPPNLGSAGAIYVAVARGLFWFDNDTSNAVAQANVGAPCFAVNDHTVGTSDVGTTLPVVGEIVAIGALGVLVDITEQATRTS